MFRKPSTALFHLLLVFLFVGDLGSVFTGANAIDCLEGWSLPSIVTKGVYVCKQKVGQAIAYPRFCSVCGRNDNQLPSAFDCHGPKPLSTTGSFPCDAGISIDEGSNPARPISCRHKDPDGVAREYRCVRQHLPQQCPEASCHV
ncbi:uncharacterized protein MELLADRAFT_123902 [Melampsora larici-populina 98AG31]|uniref:Secreted protein n=1 Tax=Melampsora larici-populina (strain 98AG31 / pathotype 3-4-7) TaxID=747676 RepID=F4RI57_MELLP|nr:uncharacterized protein MELLADRAFT_123902 [Melampsora larici-populina 98AG31]EGG07943.1 secreted protein [Melampsora larici-populina 98AG31]